jgi:riboflavin kinase/FMN adenylyltransferase
MVTIVGRVIYGKKYGRKLGFPTANLDRRDYVRRKLKIKLGIYAGYAVIGEKTTFPRPSPHHFGYAQGDPELDRMGQEGREHERKAAIVIGPIDNRGLPKIEAHLLNFKGNLYGKKVILSLGKYIRSFREFKNEGELKKQIQKDIAIIVKL